MASSYLLSTTKVCILDAAADHKQKHFKALWWRGPKALLSQCVCPLFNVTYVSIGGCFFQMLEKAHLDKARQCKGVQAAWIG
eukprot:1158891-Pelagomonas_calceolata.AAC.1